MNSDLSINIDHPAQASGLSTLSERCGGIFARIQDEMIPLPLYFKTCNNTRSHTRIKNS